MNIANESREIKNATAVLSEYHWSVRPVIIVALVLWFGLIFLLGVQGKFTGPPGSPPLPIFLGFALPLAVFFAAYFRWNAFRAFVLHSDLRLVTAMQAWRFAGFDFLALYARVKSGPGYASYHFAGRQALRPIVDRLEDRTHV